MSNDATGNHHDGNAKIASPAVALEAKKLEDLAQKFFSDKDADGPLLAFHKELQEIQKQGIDFTQSVFEQVKTDMPGPTPSFPDVTIFDEPKGGLGIEISPEGMRSLNSSVKNSSVFTLGIEGRNDKGWIAGDVFTSTGSTTPAVVHRLDQ